MRQKLRGFAAAFFLTLLFVGGIAGMTAVGYQASQALPADGWVELAREGETLPGNPPFPGQGSSPSASPPWNSCAIWWSNTPPSLSPGRCGSPWGCWLWRSPNPVKVGEMQGEFTKRQLRWGGNMCYNDCIAGVGETSWPQADDGDTGRGSPDLHNIQAE